mgnify:CR=1 FL=1
MKAKYLVIIGLLAATFAACSRDEESLFEKPAAIRAQEAIENAYEDLKLVSFDNMYYRTDIGKKALEV